MIGPRSTDEAEISLRLNFWKKFEFSRWQHLSFVLDSNRWMSPKSFSKVKHRAQNGVASAKLMRLKVPNRILVVKLKCLSEFERQLWSDSVSNDKSESKISIFDINSIIFDIFSINYLLKDRFYRPNVNYFIENDDLYRKQRYISNKMRFWI